MELSIHLGIILLLGCGGFGGVRVWGVHNLMLSHRLPLWSIPCIAMYCRTLCYVIDSCLKCYFRVRYRNTSGIICYDISSLVYKEEALNNTK